MFVFSKPPGTPTPDYFTRRYRKQGTTNSWGGPLFGVTQTPNGKPSVVISTGHPSDIDWPNFIYNDIESGVYRIGLYRMKALGSEAPSTFGQFHVNETSPGVYASGSDPVAGSSQGSVVVMWRDHSNDKLYFRRKPYTLFGNINENYSLTDTNWIVGDVTIGDGTNQKELRLKSGSVTIIWGKYDIGSQGNPIFKGPGKLTISSGSSIVLESGAKIYMESPFVSTEGGTLELGNNVIATIYGTVEAKPGSKFRFGDGASMNIINGEFKAKGSSYTNPVIFERTGTGTWDGLVFTGASIRNDTIEYARFSNTKTALSLQSKSTLRLASTVFDNSIIGVEVVNTPGDMYREIKNCRFNGISGVGISITDDSNILLDTDTLNISGSNTKGIFLSGSSPQILRTRVYTATIGLHCTNASSPVLEEGVPGGNNKFKNNSNSVTVQSSDPVLGFISGAMGDLGGQNSFEQPANTVFGTATGGSIVLAENNWWGSTKPDVGNWFLVDDESSVDYTPILNTNPNPGASILVSPTMNPGEDLMCEVLQHRADGEFVQALQKIKTIITSSAVSLRHKKWAVRQLVAMSHRLPGDRLSQYLGTLLSNQPALLRQIKSVLPNILQGEGSVSEAQTAYTANIQEYPNSDVECAALYGKFIHALYSNKDIATATTLKSLLDIRYPESGERFMARLQLQNCPGFSQSQRLALGKSESPNSTPNRFILEQNYPNPFNPATTIRFDIAEDAQVSLKIYDMLGREVYSLVDDNKKSGSYEVPFDGSTLASGLYIYRITAGTFTESRKMVLLK